MKRIQRSDIWRLAVGACLVVGYCLWGDNLVDLLLSFTQGLNPAGSAGG